MIYSLTHYQVVISIPEQFKKFFTAEQVQNGIILGGAGSYLESITLTRNSDTWSVKGDVTGSYIHTLNADKTGEMTISLNQKSEMANTLSTLANVYLNTFKTGAPFLNNLSFEKITILNLANSTEKKVVAEIKDAFLKRPADTTFGPETSNKEFSFVCGDIAIYGA